MRTKSRGIRIGSVCTAALLAGALGACGSDDEDGGDEACGHCPQGAFELAEGGELRLELIGYPDEKGSGGYVEVNAFQSFVFQGQEPAARPLAGPSFDNEAGVNCQDFRSHDNFDNGFSEEGQAIVNTRSYFDVGPTVTAIPQDGGDNQVLSREQDMLDPSSGGLVHDLLYLGGDPAALLRNAYYDIEIEGTEEYPAFDLRNGVTSQGVDWERPELFMPPDFTMLQPSETDYFTNTTFTAGEDFTFEWENNEPIVDGSPTNVMFIGFYNTAGAIDFYCLVDDEPEGTGITVPKEVIAEIEPEGGSILLGKFTHIAWNQGNRAPARFDFLGTNCKWGFYNVEEPK